MFVGLETHNPEIGSECCGALRSGPISGPEAMSQDIAWDLTKS